MEVHSIEITIKEKHINLSSATTRNELIDILGEPDEIDGISSDTKNGTILIYIDTEFHFIGDTPSSNLALIYQEMEVDGKRFTEYSVKLK